MNKNNIVKKIKLNIDFFDDVEILPAAKFLLNQAKKFNIPVFGKNKFFHLIAKPSDKPKLVVRRFLERTILNYDCLSKKVDKTSHSYQKTPILEFFYAARELAKTLNKNIRVNKENRTFLVSPFDSIKKIEKKWMKAKIVYKN
ncbi:MAG: hypothetical protein ACP5OG_02365 [Candidatus Nanoarchaeia archaeon]